MPFDYDAAMKEGYTDTEIADFLGKQHGFDVLGARKEGYKDSEIVQHLMGNPSEEKGAKQEPPSPSRGWLGDIASGAARGVLVRFPEMVGRAVKPIAPEFGETLVAGTKALEQEHDILRPSKEEKESYLRGSVTGGLESVPSSLAIPLTGAAIGTAIMPGPGTVIGGTIGTLANLAGFYGSTYDKFMEDAKTNNVAEDKAKPYAHLSAAIESGGELLSDLVGLFTFGTGKVGTKAATTTLRQALKPTAKELAKAAGKTLAAEVGTEVGQNVGERWAEQQVGIPGESLYEAGKEAIGPAAVMTALIGGSYHGLRTLNRKSMEQALEKPVPKDMTGDIAAKAMDARSKTVDIITQTLAQNKDYSQIAPLWHIYAQSRVQANQPIDMDVSLDKDTLASLISGKKQEAGPAAISERGIASDYETDLGPMAPLSGEEVTETHTAREETGAIRLPPSPIPAQQEAAAREKKEAFDKTWQEKIDNVNIKDVLYESLAEGITLSPAQMEEYTRRGGTIPPNRVDLLTEHMAAKERQRAAAGRKVTLATTLDEEIKAGKQAPEAVYKATAAQLMNKTPAVEELASLKPDHAAGIISELQRRKTNLEKIASPTGVGTAALSLERVNTLLDIVGQGERRGPKVPTEGFAQSTLPQEEALEGKNDVTIQGEEKEPRDPVQKAAPTYTDEEVLRLGEQELTYAGRDQGWAKDDYPNIVKVGKKQYIEDRNGVKYIYYDVFAEMKDGTKKHIREIGPYKYQSYYYEGHKQIFNENAGQARQSRESARIESDNVIRFINAALEKKKPKKEAGQSKPTVPEKEETPPVSVKEKAGWYINADDRPVFTVPSDAIGYRGPYGKQEVSELTGTAPDDLNKVKRGEPVYTAEYPKERYKKREPKETPREGLGRDSFYYHLDKGFIKVEDAEPVTIKGHEDLNLFVHRTPEEEDLSYTVTEGRSGFALAKGINRDVAIAHAENNLNKVGRERLEEVVEHTAAKHGVSPNYEGKYAPSDRAKLIGRIDNILGEYSPGLKHQDNSRTAKHILGAIETGEYSTILDPKNKASRKVFETLTGIKLPTTIKGTTALFTGKPFEMKGTVSTIQKGDNVTFTNSKGEVIPGVVTRIYKDGTVDVAGARRVYKVAQGRLTKVGGEKAEKPILDNGTISDQKGKPVYEETIGSVRYEIVQEDNKYNPALKWRVKHYTTEGINATNDYFKTEREARDYVDGARQKYERDTTLKDDKTITVMPEVTPKEGLTNLTSKPLNELVSDIFSIINNHIGERGSVSGKKVAVNDSLYEKLKPYLAEIARRAKEKALDVKAYLFGAVDSQPEGQAKQLYESAAERYVGEVGGEGPRKTATGILGQRADRVVQAGYRFIKGDLDKKSDLYWDMVGIMSGAYADRLLGSGITVEKTRTKQGQETEHPKHPLLSGRGATIPTQSQQLATWVKDSLTKGELVTKLSLIREAGKVFGGTMAEGKYQAKDAYDALEMGINQFILARSEQFDVTANLPQQARLSIDSIRQEIMEKIPSQQGLRSEEQDEFQQFSTPPDLAWIMAWVANIQEGTHWELRPAKLLRGEQVTKKDIVLEPSAGIGGIAVFAKNAGAKVIVNELSARRAGILKEMGFDEVHTENAEQIYNILHGEVEPTVVIMNPPFSATAGRIKRQRKSANVVQHLDQALKLLQPGGRMVALIGKGWYADPRAVSDYFAKLKQDYNFRAIITVNGKNYAKYGTTYDNRILVIDKTAPEGNPTLEASVDDVKDAIPLLKEIRDARAPIPEQQAIESEGERVSPASQGTGEPGVSVLPATGKVGDRERGPGNRLPGGGKPEYSPAGRSEAGNEQAGAGEPSRPDGAFRPAEWLEGTARPRVGGTRSASGSLSADARTDEATDQGLTVTKKERKEKNEELSDSVFESYTPQKVSIAGAKDHPGNLVESAAMAVVEPPDPAYSPNLPEKAIKQGKFSIAQLEATVYAGRAHQEMLPVAVLDGDGNPTGKFYRKGFFIGDGTGVGKGREIVSILWDNFRQGRTKAIWISQNAPLVEDARRDMSLSGWDADLVFDMSKMKIGNPLAAKQGVAFLGYDLLKSKDRKNDKISRLNQLVEWFGRDYDGVIVFDEAHNMGNALAVRKLRGTSKPSAKALAGVELQRLLPNARVVYVSATGATEVMNLSYADRLGLWGEGTPFASKADFVGQISAGGVAAMEFVARDMKAMGSYMSRSLSYEDVKYDRLEHALTADQREIYDELATAWQGVLADIERALKITGGAHNGDAASAAKSAFWGSLQRFFNQIITSMQTPSVIRAVERDMEAGHSVIIQLVNTNEAAQERALAKMEEGDELEDLDLTPREQLMQYIQNSFPVAQYEEVDDPENPDRTKWVPVLDSNGQPVENPEAVAQRETLLNKLGSIKVPDNPVDMIINHFGHKNVAEITGRGRRVITVTDEKGTHKVIEKRSQSKTMADADAFMADNKRILMFSYAGGTGRSYHADLAAKNQRLRRHYLLQAGWRADRAIQGFGRSHRTSQRQAPEYILVTTDVIGQKRFISSIARRLDQLGALTRGQRDTASGGFFTARDNLESSYAQDAINRLIQDIYRHQVPNWDISEFIQQTGLTRLVDPRDGSLNVNAIPPVTQFLNRMLAMHLDKQVEVFNLFSTRLDENIRKAMADGTLDVGLETLRAKNIKKVQEQIVHTDEKSGAETKYVQLDVTQKAPRYSFENIKNTWADNGFYRNVKSGQVWAVSRGATKTDARTGELSTVHRLRGPRGTAHEVDSEVLHNAEKYSSMSMKEAEEAWTKEYNELPETVTYQEHLVTGALLPVWDRLPETASRIMRVQTDEGERMIGRLLNASDLANTLTRLGATREQSAYNPERIFSNVKEHGFTYELANGWRLKRVKVGGEQRIELVGPDYRHFDELKRHGVFVERVDWQTRTFIPTSGEGVDAIKAITATRPAIVESAPLYVREDLGDKAPQYTTRSYIPGNLNTLSELKRIFKGQKIAVTGSGAFRITTKSGHILQVETVDFISPDEIAFKIGYGKASASGVTIMGQYKHGTIMLSRWEADKFVVAHESVHFLEDAGLLTSTDIAVLRGEIKRLAKEGKWTPVNRKDIGGAEDRANYIAEQLTNPTAKGFAARVIARIRDLIDKLMEAFGRERTARGVVRSVETGEVFERRGDRTYPFREGQPQFKAEGGKEFVKNPADGSIDFGWIPQEIEEKSEGRFPAAPIRLEKGEKWAYGHAHISPERIKEMKEAGYGDELDMLQNITSNFTDVYEQPNGRLLLVKKNGQKKYAAVELQKDADNYYGVTTWFLDEKNPKGKPYEERSKRKLLLHVARATDTGKSAPFIPSGNQDRTERDWRSGESSYKQSIAQGDKTGKEPKYSARVAQEPSLSDADEALATKLDDETRAFMFSIAEKVKSPLWREIFGSPEWHTHPVMQRLVKLFTDKRTTLYHDRFNYLTDGDAEESVVDEMDRLKGKGLSTAQKIMGQTSKEYKLLQKIIDNGDVYHISPKRMEKWFAENNIPDDVVHTWRRLRESWDKALDLMQAQMRELIKAEEEKGPGKKSTLHDELKKALAMMDEWRGSYAPRIRPVGNYVLQAHKKGEGEDKQFFRTHGSAREMDKLASEMSRKGWITKVDKLQRLPEATYQNIKTVEVANLIEQALKDTKDQVAATAFNNEILQLVADTIRARGFRQTMIHRGDTLVTGYILDPIERYLRYTNSIAGGLSKAEVAREGMTMLSEIDPAKEPRIHNLAQLYVQENLRNAEPIDRALAIAKSIATFKFLGFNLRSIGVNLTAVATTAPPAIQQYGLNGEGSMTKIMAALGRAGTDYTRFMAGKPLLNAKDQAFLEFAKKEGYDDPQYTRDAMDKLSTLQGKLWSKIMSGSMYLFGKSEQWNRGTTMLAAYRLATEHGMPEEEARERAREASNKAHGVYGKGTLPFWAMGENVGAKVGQMMYVYSKFGHNYAQMLHDLGMKKRNVKAFAWAIMAPLALAGAAAFPFKDELLWIIKAILRFFGIDDDPEKMVWDSVRKHLGKGAEIAGRHGLTGLAGVDISSSLAVGVGIPTGLLDLTGAIGGAAQDIAKAGGYVATGQYMRALEKALPTAAANPLRAYRESQTGLVTEKGFRVFSDEGKPATPSAGQSIARAFGFRSAEQATTAERTQEAKTMEERFTNKRKAIYESYRAWYVNPEKDPDDWKHIWNEIKEYNRSVLGKKLHKQVPIINGMSLRTQAARLDKPTTKERSRLVNYPAAS